MLELKKAGKETAGQSTQGGIFTVDENVFWQIYNGGLDGWKLVVDHKGDYSIKLYQKIIKDGNIQHYVYQSLTRYKGIKQ